MVRAATVTMARFTLIAHVLFLLQLRSLAIAWKLLRFLIYFSPAYCAVRIVVIRFSPQRFRRFDCASIFRRIADAYTPPTSPMQSGDDILKCYGCSQQPRHSLRRLSSISLEESSLTQDRLRQILRTIVMFTVVAVAIYYVCINPMKALVWAGIVQGVRRSRTCLGVKLTQDGFDRVRFLSENSFRRDPNKLEQHSINLQGYREGWISPVVLSVLPRFVISRSAVRLRRVAPVFSINRFGCLGRCFT